MPEYGMDRRTFLGRSAAVGGSIMLAGAVGSACGSTSGGSPTTTGGDAPQGPSYGGSLTVGTMAEIDGFLPSQNRWDTN